MCVATKKISSISKCANVDLEAKNPPDPSPFDQGFRCICSPPGRPFQSVLNPWTDRCLAKTCVALSRVSQRGKIPVETPRVGAVSVFLLHRFDDLHGSEVSESSYIEVSHLEIHSQPVVEKSLRTPFLTTKSHQHQQQITFFRGPRSVNGSFWEAQGRMEKSKVSPNPPFDQRYRDGALAKLEAFFCRENPDSCHSTEN